MGVAQLVELLVVVQAVAGSSPVAHPSRNPHQTRGWAWSLRNAPEYTRLVPQGLALVGLAGGLGTCAGIDLVAEGRTRLRRGD